MTNPSEYPDRCPFCGLILLSGNIFDACNKESEYGPILGLHKDVDRAAAKAGYVGISSLWQYDQAPWIYTCPRCRLDPISGKTLKEMSEDNKDPTFDRCH